VEIRSDDESAIAPSIGRSCLSLRTHISRSQKLRSHNCPVASSRKPIITNPRIGCLHFVISREVIEGHHNTYAAILDTWSGLDSNFECQMSLGVWIGSLRHSCLRNRQDLVVRSTDSPEKMRKARVGMERTKFGKKRDPL